MEKRGLVLISVLVILIFASNVLAKKPHTHLTFLNEQKGDHTIVKGSVFYDDQEKTYSFKKDTYDESAAAYGTITVSMMITGWDTLALSTY